MKADCKHHCPPCGVGQLCQRFMELLAILSPRTRADRQCATQSAGRAWLGHAPVVRLLGRRVARIPALTHRPSEGPPARQPIRSVTHGSDNQHALVTASATLPQLAQGPGETCTPGRAPVYCSATAELDGYAAQPSTAPSGAQLYGWLPLMVLSVIDTVPEKV